MRAFLGPALVLLLILTAITGIAYPLAMTGTALLLFPAQARGSLVTSGDGRPIGSALIAQPTGDAGRFQTRPSAAAADGSLSSGTNLGPTNPVLTESLTTRARRARAERGVPGDTVVPTDLITASGSGLDPHLSPAAARWQAPRIAAVRGTTVARLDSLIAAHTETRFLRLFGEPRINVLALNLALDSIAGPRQNGR